MIFSTHMIGAEANDVSLVEASMAGNRDAFAIIVSRYQSLICSLAYSATGSLTQSEDLAQETFVVAWREMNKLKEPQKLRSWLCGIARNVISNTLRRTKHEPTQHAEPIDSAFDLSADGPATTDHVIQREEEAILWRSLEQIPETYREPLVLFYREGESIERVAQQLELSEDAVKQRLSRGRKLLADEVTAFVEKTLKLSSPGRAFTIGVLAALPAFATSAKAATIGVSAAKGSSLAKSAGLLGMIGAVMSVPLMFLGNYFGYRLDLDSANSENERQYVRTFYKRLGLVILGFFIAYSLFACVASSLHKTDERLWVHIVIGLSLSYSIAIVWLTVWSLRRRKQLIAEMSAEGLKAAARPAWEFKSQSTLLGLPLLHIRIGGGIRTQQKPVKAWIAVGDTAIGGLFAFGGIAIAPFSLGGLAIGLVGWGGCSIGLLALGGLSVGIWSFGGLLIGWESYGGCAIAWHAAAGGTALAHDFAVGGTAHALQANNKVASNAISAMPFFIYADFVFRHFMAWLNLVWVVPMFIWWRVVKKAKKG